MIEQQQMRHNGLLRIIMIDVSKSGLENIVHFAGGCVLEGGNGVGKSTLLRLLPIFYGEEPRNVIPTGGSKLPFAEYYLPNETSYIVYEYANAFGVHCVVVCRDYTSRESRFVYRFVDSPYCREFFISEDGEKFTSARDIKARIGQFGSIDVSREIRSIKQYRHVLQNLSMSDVPDAGIMRDLAAKYALTAGAGVAGVSKRIPHIERVASEMIDGKANFDVLRSIVLSSVRRTADNASELSLNPQFLKECVDWPKRFGAYMAVMRHEPMVVDALARRAVLNDARSTLLSAHQSFNQLTLSLESTISTGNQTIQLSKEGQDKMRREHSDRSTELRGNIAEADQLRKDLNKKVGKIEATQARYDSSDIEQQAAAYDDLDNMKVRKDERSKRKESLLGEHKERENAKDAEINRRQAKLLNDKTAAMHARDQRVAEIDEAHDKALAREVATRDESAKLAADALAAAERDANDKNAAFIEIQTRSKSISETPEESARLKQVGEELEAAQETLLDLTGELRKSDDAKRSATTAFERADAGVRRAENEERLAKEALAELDARSTPKEGSLLEFLSKTRPGWQQTIGRVVRPEVLHHTGLNPVPVDEGESFYGVAIETAALQPVAEADEDRMREERQRALDRISLAAQGRVTANVEFEAAHRALEAAKRYHTETEIAAEKARRSADHLKKRLAEVRSENADAIEQRRASLKAQLDEAKTQRDAASKRLTEARAATEAVQKTFEQRGAELGRQATTDKARASADLKAATARLDAEAKTDIDEITAQYEAALQKDGLQQAIRDIEAEISKITAAIATATGYKQAVEEWRAWTKYELPTLEELRRQRDAATANHAKLEADKAKLDDDHAKAEDRVEKEIQRVQKQVNDAVANRASAFNQMDKILSTLDIEREGFINEAPLLELTSLESLAALVMPLGGKYRDNLRTIKSAVGTVKGEFDSFDATRQMWQELLPKLAEGIRDDGAPYDARAFAFMEGWYGDAGYHRNERKVLLQGALLIYTSIQTFLRELEDFDRGVKAFSSQLQDHLESNVNFSKIRRINVKIVSRARNEDYFDVVTRVRSEYRAFFEASSESSELPDKHFGDLVERIGEQFGRRGSLTAKLGELIDIEGYIEEVGKEHKVEFHNARDLEEISSTGLSHIVVTLILLAFINKVRRESGINFVWCMDEMGKIDPSNAAHLFETFQRNNITLVCAAPDLNYDVKSMFRNIAHIRPLTEGGMFVESYQQQEEAFA